MVTERLENLGSEDAKWLGEYSQVHMNVFGTPLRVMDHGKGAHIWDVDGNEYLDFLAGIAVNALGYAHPKWVKAVSEQAAKAAHVSNYFATEPQIKLASKLIELAGAPEGSHVYFGNSGAEGNEAALKLAKLYGRTLPGASPAIGGKPARIIAMTHGFHGRTMGALSATWKPSIREAFEPLVPNIEFVEASDEAALHDAFAETGPGKYGKGPVAAVIMVLMQRVLTGMPYTPIGLVIAPLATVLRWALEMMSWGVFIWVVMTWLNPQSPMTYALGTLVDPFVRPVRKIIPMFGRFDLSPIVVIILANVLLMLVTPISHGFIPL